MGVIIAKFGCHHKEKVMDFGVILYLTNAIKSHIIVEDLLKPVSCSIGQGVDMSIQNNTEYNVYCFDCGQVFSPLPGSPLWWQAKQRADRGFLDALCVNGKECGCDTVKPIDRPDAPFRVFGYDMLLEDFDIPFYRLSEAIDEFRRRNRGPDVVLISGVSQAVQDRLHHISR